MTTGNEADRASANQMNAATGPSSAPLSPEEVQKRAAQSKHLAATFGEIISVLMRSNSYRGLTLAQIERLIIPTVITGQFSLAEAQSKQNGFMAPVAVVMWASVSPEVDAKLEAEADALVTLPLKAWNSGDIVWLIDAVGDSRIIGPMLKQLHKTRWGGRPVKARMKGNAGETSVRTLDLEAPTT